MRSAITLLPSLLLLALACVGESATDLPRGMMLRPVAAAVDSTLACPALDGEFVIERALIWNRLVRPSLTEEQRRLPWSVLTVRGDAVVGLDLILRSGERVDSVRLTRGTQYECASGWLLPRGEIWLADLSDEDSSRIVNDAKRDEITLSIAADTSGTLIGRVHIRSWSQFDVWCGDGCKGFPIPFTGEDRIQWEYLGAASGPPVGAPDVDVSRRVAAEERALEMGTPSPRPANLVRAVKDMMPPGSDILAVTPDGAGFRYSVVLPKDTDVPAFIGRLVETQGLSGAHEMPHYGAWTLEPPRRWRTVIWVPKP